jgi:phosphoribosylformylglycinamidine cyclo-ligase
VDNIPRMLPRSCDVIIRQGSWPVLPIFDLIARGGRVEPAEMHHVFNMGIGMTAIVKAGAATRILRSIRVAGHQAWVIGEVVPGRGRVRLT